jgi:flagellar biosynthesis/type III secretory pathway protein FliH
VDFVTQQHLGEIEHQVLYLTPKHLGPKIPEPYHEWLQAITDSLDEQVEESDYHNPVVLKVFDLIQRDGLTPKDCARMKDEYSMEEVKQEEFKKGVTQGFAQGEAQGLAKGEAQGLAKGEAQGERKMQLSLAQKLLRQGQLDLVSIADLTGLTIEELHSL